MTRRGWLPTYIPRACINSRERKHSRFLRFAGHSRTFSFRMKTDQGIRKYFLVNYLLIVKSSARISRYTVVYARYCYTCVTTLAIDITSHPYIDEAIAQVKFSDF